ncbi:MAG TPA: hypothetical protein VLL82_18175 [Mycobacterium sp.]|nr:hypothetical protein [Mycobacterium sp.]
MPSSISTGASASSSRFNARRPNSAMAYSCARTYLKNGACVVSARHPGDASDLGRSREEVNVLTEPCEDRIAGLLLQGV